MNKSDPSKTDRRTIAAVAGGSLFGAFSSIFVGEARAQDGGAAAAQLGVLIKTFNDYRKQFTDTAEIISGVRDSVKSGIDKYFEWTSDFWALNDAINGLMTAGPGLGTQIKDLPKEILGHVKYRMSEVEALRKAYEDTAQGKPNTRHGLAFRSRARAGRALGETAALTVRDKYVKIAKTLEGRSAKTKSKGELFQAATAPLAMEQTQLILEALLRIEARLDRFLEVMGSQEFHEPVKPLSKEETEKAFEGLKKGRGTLLDDGEGKA